MIKVDKGLWTYLGLLSLCTFVGVLIVTFNPFFSAGMAGVVAMLFLGMTWLFNQAVRRRR